MTNWTKRAELINYLKKMRRWVTADEIASGIDSNRKSVHKYISRLYEYGEIDKKREKRVTMYRYHVEVADEGEKAGPRTYVNASMPNGSASWWKQYLGGMGFAR